MRNVAYHCYSFTKALICFWYHLICYFVTRIKQEWCPVGKDTFGGVVSASINSQLLAMSYFFIIDILILIFLSFGAILFLYTLCLLFDHGEVWYIQSWEILWQHSIAQKPSLINFNSFLYSYWVQHSMYFSQSYIDEINKMMQYGFRWSNVVASLSTSRYELARSGICIIGIVNRAMTNHLNTMVDKFQNECDMEVSCILYFFRWSVGTIRPLIP